MYANPSANRQTHTYSEKRQNSSKISVSIFPKRITKHILISITCTRSFGTHFTYSSSNLQLRSQHIKGLCNRIFFVRITIKLF